jgi:hypothetical protein
MELRKFLGCQTDFVFLNRAYPCTGLTPACSPAFLTLGYLRVNRFKKHFKESAVTGTVTDGTFAVAFRLSGKHFDGIAIWTLDHGSTSLLLSPYPRSGETSAAGALLDSRIFLPQISF